MIPQEVNLLPEILKYIFSIVDIVSFHGTAFALLSEKEFVVVERSEDFNARITDLLTDL